MAAASLRRRGADITRAASTEALYDANAESHSCVVVDLVPEASRSESLLYEGAVNIRLWLEMNPATFAVVIVDRANREAAKRFKPLRNVTVITDKEAFTDVFWSTIYREHHANLDASRFLQDIYDCAARLAVEDETPADAWRARLQPPLTKLIVACRRESSVQELALQVFPPRRKGVKNARNSARQRLHQWCARHGYANPKSIITLTRIGWLLKYRSLGWKFSLIARLLQYPSYDAMRSAVHAATGLSPTELAQQAEYTRFIECMTRLLLHPKKDGTEVVSSVIKACRVTNGAVA